MGNAEAGPRAVMVIARNLLRIARSSFCSPERFTYFASSSFSFPERFIYNYYLASPIQNLLAVQTPASLSSPLDASLKLTALFHPSSPVRFLNTTTNSTLNKDDHQQHPLKYEETEGGETEEGETTDGWEEEDEAEPEVDDGGDGGGVVLQGVPWGERVLSIAREVLLQFGSDIKLYAFKTTPRGYVYVRLDKLSNEYGCPSMEELENYSQEYKKKLDEVGALGEIPDDLALEVSTPGAERILRVPDDLGRFKDMPMRVCYEDAESDCTEKDGVFLLEDIETDSGSCVWKLADVKENRDHLSKGT